MTVDPFEGATRKPLTLNDYAYANANPIGNVDPGGQFTIMGVSTSGAIGMSLQALTIVGLFENAEEIGDSLGLLGALMVSAIGGPAGFDALAQNAPSIGALALAAIGGPDKHHTIPIYMCGPRTQGYAHIDYTDHARLHAMLYAGVVGINTVAEVYVKRYLKKPGKGGREVDDPIVLLAKKRAGREVIANFLEYFYNANGLWDKGLPSRRIRDVYPREKDRFIKGATSLPTCKR